MLVPYLSLFAAFSKKLAEGTNPAPPSPAIEDRCFSSGKCRNARTNEIYVAGMGRRLPGAWQSPDSNRWPARDTGQGTSLGRGRVKEEEAPCIAAGRRTRPGFESGAFDQVVVAEEASFERASSLPTPALSARQSAGAPCEVETNTSSSKRSSSLFMQV